MEQMQKDGTNMKPYLEDSDLNEYIEIVRTKIYAVQDAIKNSAMVLLGEEAIKGLEL